MNKWIDAKLEFPTDEKLYPVWMQDELVVAKFLQKEKKWKPLGFNHAEDWGITHWIKVSSPIEKEVSDDNH